MLDLSNDALSILIDYEYGLFMHWILYVDDLNLRSIQWIWNLDFEAADWSNENLIIQAQFDFVPLNS